MSLRTALLGVEDLVTNVIATLDLIPHGLTIRTRTWLGGYIDAPVTSGPQFTDVDLALPKKLFVRQLTTREVDASGGRFEMGDLEISGIIPNDVANGPSEGVTPAQLKPHVAAQGTEIIYVLTGPHAGEYALSEMRTDDSFEYKIVLTRRSTTPSVT